MTRKFHNALTGGFAFILTATILAGCGKKDKENASPDTEQAETIEKESVSAAVEKKEAPSPEVVREQSEEDRKREEAQARREEKERRDVRMTRFRQMPIPDLKEAAGNGDPDAQCILGEKYMANMELQLTIPKGGVKQDYGEAAHWFLLAAKKGHPYAQRAIGFLHKEGWGVERDLEQTLYWYGKAIEQDDDTAMMELAGWYADGDGIIKKNEVEAWKLFYRAEQLNNPRARNKLDYLLGSKVLKKAAEQGVVDAQYDLGLAYLKGRSDFEQEIFRAVIWFGEAAKQGHEGARKELDVLLPEIRVKAEKDNSQYYQHVLAECHFYGWGVEENDDEALKWYRKAAERGYAPSMFKLGYCYEEGFGVEKDMEKALEWYRKAAELDDSDAKQRMKLYETEKEIEQMRKEREERERRYREEEEKLKREQAEAAAKREQERNAPDDDADGFSNAQEKLLGTDPDNPLSHPKYITKIAVSAVSRVRFNGLELQSVDMKKPDKKDWQITFNVLQNNRKRSVFVRFGGAFKNDNVSFEIVDVEVDESSRNPVVYIRRADRADERIPCLVKEAIYEPTRAMLQNTLNDQKFAVSVGETFNLGDAKTGEESYKVLSVDPEKREVMVESPDGDKFRYILNPQK